MSQQQEKYAWDCAVERYETDLQRELSVLIHGVIDTGEHKIEISTASRRDVGRIGLNQFYKHDAEKYSGIWYGYPASTTGFYDFSGEKISE